MCHFLPAFYRLIFLWLYFALSPKVFQGCFPNSPIAESPGVAGKIQTLNPSTYLQSQNFWRCSLGIYTFASVRERHTLLIFLVRNKLFFQLFWLLDIFLWQQQDHGAMREVTSIWDSGAYIDPEAAGPRRCYILAGHTGVQTLAKEFLWHNR